MAVLVAGLMMLGQVVVDNDPVVLAAEAGVETQALLEAMADTGLSAQEYLWMSGELRRPAAVTVAEAPSPRATGKWDRLAACEASGDWHNARNPRYKGGLQMDSTFWARYGGLAFAPAPHLASREQQIVVAERGLAVQGPGAWPVCGRRTGLTR